MMAGSSFGTIFRITTWGESHGKGLGVVIDGCPSGIELCEEDIQRMLDRRRPGVSDYTTSRKESDKAVIMSGVFEGKTTGTPISIMVYNEDHHSEDYSDIANFYRPGHADYTFDCKYGFRDYRGGGRSSGRETVARVAAGAVACKLLQALGIEVCAYTQCIGGIGIDYDRFDILQRDMNPFAIPDKDAADSIELYARQAIADKDSLGGIIECVIKNMPAGVGEPVFDKLDANLSKAIMSIGAVKGFEIGEGFMVAELKGSENNDEFYMDGDKVKKRTNHSGRVDYVPAGLDAAVSWGDPDFQFCNNTEYPIRISATYADGSVNVKIYGTKTNSNTVKVTTQQLDAQSYKTYRHVYDQDGNLLETEEICSSHYIS